MILPKIKLCFSLTVRSSKTSLHKFYFFFLFSMFPAFCGPACEIGTEERVRNKSNYTRTLPEQNCLSPSEKGPVRVCHVARIFYCLLLIFSYFLSACLQTSDKETRRNYSNKERNKDKVTADK